MPFLGCALHICCALGHVELFEYLLAHVAHATSKHLSDHIGFHSGASDLPFLKIVECSHPLDYAIAYDQARVLGHLLAQVQDPPIKLPTETHFRWENSHSLKLHSCAIPDWLHLSAFYNALQCVQLLVQFCEQHPSWLSTFAPFDRQDFFLVAAFRGPSMPYEKGPRWNWYNDSGIRIPL